LSKKFLKNDTFILIDKRAIVTEIFVWHDRNLCGVSPKFLCGNTEKKWTAAAQTLVANTKKAEFFANPLYP